MPQPFDCESTNVDVTKDYTVDYGRGANAAAAEQDAEARARAQSQRDAQKKAENEYACQPPCRIRGTARVTKTNIEVPGWRDPRGLWHATAKATWWLTVYCVRAGVSAKKKSAKRSGKKATGRRTPARKTSRKAR